MLHQQVKQAEEEAVAINQKAKEAEDEIQRVKAMATKVGWARSKRGARP